MIHLMAPFYYASHARGSGFDLDKTVSLALEAVRRELESGPPFDPPTFKLLRSLIMEKALAANNQVFEAAAEVLLAEVSFNGDSQSASALFNAIISQESTLRGFSNAMKNDENRFQSLSTEMLKEFINDYTNKINQDHYDDEALAAAARVLLSRAQWSYPTFRLFCYFVRKEKYVEDTIALAEILLKVFPIEFPRTLAYELFELLFEKGWGFNEALTAAKTGLFKEEDDVCSSFFEKMFQKEEGFTAFVNSISDAKESYNWLFEMHSNFLGIILEGCVPFVQAGMNCGSLLSVLEISAASPKEMIRNVSVRLIDLIASNRGRHIKSAKALQGDKG